MAWGVIAGIGLGIGLALFVSAIPHLGRRIIDRVAPFVADVSPGAFSVTEAQNASGWTLHAVLHRLRALVAWLGPNTVELERRMRKAGRSGGAGRARIELATAATVGLACGVIIASAVAAPVFIRISIPILGVLGAVWGMSLNLSVRASRRQARIERDLPTVLEFLTLSITSGEALPDALARVSRIGSGDLVAEISEIVRLESLGVPLSDALRDAAEALEIPAFERLMHQLLAAISRGSPLSDVLRAQAADQRVEFKRQLLESAGKKEIGMMIPLVFLILPVTVLFAVWPGVIVLNSGM